MNHAEIEEDNSFSIFRMIVIKDFPLNEGSLGYLNRCKRYFSPLDTAAIYKAIIRPKVEYNSISWAFTLIGDRSITDKIHSLEHRRIVL